MKKSLLVFLVLMLFPFAVSSQNIFIGERVPELRVSTWLGGEQPTVAPLTYIEFFHSTNPSCLTSVERLKDISDKLGAKLRIIVVSKEKEEIVSPLLAPYLSPRITVGLDPSGKTFTLFGVNYVPFGVLTDEKNRTLWLGNTLQLTPELIEKNFK